MSETIFSKIITGEILALKFMKMIMSMPFRYFSSNERSYTVNP